MDACGRKASCQYPPFSFLFYIKVCVVAFDGHRHGDRFALCASVKVCMHMCFHVHLCSITLVEMQ